LTTDALLKGHGLKAAGKEVAVGDTIWRHDRNGVVLAKTLSDGLQVKDNAAPADVPLNHW